MSLLTSAVIAAIVSGAVVLLTSERHIAAENVIQERMKWRTKIREIVCEVRKALVEDDALKLAELRAQFSLHLNPHDPKDQRILALIAPNNGARVEELTQRVALLLKHDWERAKYEASLYRRLRDKPPERLAFEDFIPGREHDYRRPRFF